MRCGVDGVLPNAMPFARWRMSASLPTTDMNWTLPHFSKRARSGHMVDKGLPNGLRLIGQRGGTHGLRTHLSCTLRYPKCRFGFARIPWTTPACWPLQLLLT